MVEAASIPEVEVSAVSIKEVVSQPFTGVGLVAFTMGVMVTTVLTTMADITLTAGILIPTMVGILIIMAIRRMPTGSVSASALALFGDIGATPPPMDPTLALTRPTLLATTPTAAPTMIRAITARLEAKSTMAALCRARRRTCRVAATIVIWPPAAQMRNTARRHMSRKSRRKMLLAFT